MAVLLQLQNIQKRYGFQTVLDGVDMTISEGQKIGMIGRNGAGKSTLVKIIVEQESADEGEVVRHPPLRLGYLQQHDPFLPEETVLAFLERDTQKPEWECARVAAQFELKKQLLTSPITSLSGGYQMRVKLAALFLHDPNLLLLDEPTNYLDLRTLILLEKNLQRFRGSFIVISHDREFLKQTCEQTMEVERGKLTFYPGPLEEYFAHKEGQRETIERYNRKVEAQREHLQSFVDRFRAQATKATAAQSKLKQIAKLHTIEIEHPLKNVRIRIPPPENSKGVALYARELVIGYPNKRVAEHIGCEVNRGDHVAILGDNGQGKSTLLKTLAGEIPAIDGTMRWFAKARVAYYAQHVQQMLPTHLTVQEYLTKTAEVTILPQDILRMAGNFLFSDDDLEKPISVLSGGERARLCLAGILLKRHSVLLLDEPTNHLDVETVEALGAALHEFPGTIIFISHDRTFVNQIANIIFEVRNGEIKRFPGTYQDYIYHLEQAADEETKEDSTKSRIDELPTEIVRSKQEIHGAIGDLKRVIKKLEQQMEATKKEKDVILQDFLENPLAYSRERHEELDKISKQLESQEEDWLAHQEKMEQLNAELEQARERKTQE